MNSSNESWIRQNVMPATSLNKKIIKNHHITVKFGLSLNESSLSMKTNEFFRIISVFYHNPWVEFCLKLRFLGLRNLCLCRIVPK